MRHVTLLGDIVSPISSWASPMRSATLFAWIALLLMSPEMAKAGGELKAPPPPSEPNKLPPPGTVISESTRGMGHGYKEVSRSIVNGPKAFEGIGHFTFVYFKNRELCQCSEHEVLRSPDGLHAFFIEAASGRLFLFHTATGNLTKISNRYIGHPIRVFWESGRAKVIVEKDNAGKTVAKTINVAL